MSASWTLRAMGAELQKNHHMVGGDDMVNKWAHLTELAIFALQTAVSTLKEIIQQAQVDEEFTAFSRFIALLHGNEIANALLDFVLFLDDMMDCLPTALVDVATHQYVIKTLMDDDTITKKQPRFRETHHLAELAVLMMDFEGAGVPLDYGSQVTQMQHNRLSMMRKEIVKLSRLLN